MTLRWLVLSLLLLPLAAGCADMPPPQTGAILSRAQGPTLQVVPSPLFAAPLFSLGAEPYQLLFQINLTNPGDHPLRLERLTLRLEQQGRLLEQRVLEAPQLAQRLRPAPWIVIQDRQSLAAAHRQRGRLERAAGTTDLPAGAARSLHELLLFSRSEELPGTLELAVQHSGGLVGTSTAVQIYQQQTALRLPLDGAGWWVLAGHRGDEYHGAAVMLSQSFAYDLARVGAGGGTFSGDPRRNASYLAFGSPVLAAADGTVVDLHDGLPDNDPVGERPSWQEVLRRPADLAGNYVVLAHLGGEHTAYLHLSPGLAVSRGQRLRAGQLLGRCGNSGNSLEPHLHFQLQDGPDLLRANGRPIRFADFTVLDGGRAYYVSPDRPLPLPSRLGILPGRSPGAFLLPPPLAPVRRR